MTKSKTLGGLLDPIHFPVDVFQQNLLDWYNANKAAHPWRLHWQKYRDPYIVWVSEIMLQQTTLAAMIPVFERFIMRFPNLRALSQATEEEIKKKVQGLGYYRRFSLLHKGAQKIVNASGAYIQWPESYDQWMEVSGVGDYTAAALSSITLEESVPVLDGNVIRVFCRLFDIRKAANDNSLKKDLKRLGCQLVPQKTPGDFNQGLMELGQKICRPMSPSCESCPVQSFCLSYKRESTHLAPLPKVRREADKVKVRLHIFEKENSFGLVKRPDASKFLKRTSGFLTEIFDGHIFRRDGDAKARSEFPKGLLLGTVGHSITHHQIKAEVYVLNVEQERELPLRDNIEWVEKKKLTSQLVSSLDLKAWSLFEKQAKGRLI